MISLIIFSLVTLYGLIYSMIATSRKYKQIPITEDVFETLVEMRNEYGASTSDVIAAAFNVMRRELAKRNALKG